MYLSCIFTFCLCSIIVEVTTISHNVPEVSTPLGKVQGQFKTSFDGRQYAAFEGIPYAKPPIGELRFEEPQAAEPWPGIWNATHTYECLQNSIESGRSIIGSEDCLYVNVYVPVTDQQELDVVVHIHGGAFMFGSGTAYLNSKFVVDRDIIFVTFNYRLGALGFASAGDEVLPGNNGLKDQVLALKWVQQNIKSFGGNPGSVTLTGFSAGAASVHLHYFSPLSKGLFHRGMSLSGTALNGWATTEHATENTNKLSSLLGCPVSDTKELIGCLKTRPAIDIVEKTKYIYPFFPAPLALFAPVVERKSKNPFLSKSPLALLKEGNVLDLPWITSVTRDEGLLIGLLFVDKLEALNERWEEVAPYVLHNEILINRKNILNKLKEFYLGEEKEFNFDNFNILAKMLADHMLNIGAESAAKLQSKVVKSPVYFYLFNYEGENTLQVDFSPNLRLSGASHGDDMLYFFGATITKALSESDVKLREACMDTLYSYAKYGVPSFKGADWKPTNSEELTFLNITGPEDINLQTTTYLSFAGKFWNELGLENTKDEL